MLQNIVTYFSPCYISCHGLKSRSNNYYESEEEAREALSRRDTLVFEPDQKQWIEKITTVIETIEIE